MSGEKPVAKGVLKNVAANAVYPLAVAGVVYACIRQAPITANQSHHNAVVLSILAIVLVAAFAILAKGAPVLAWPWRRRPENLRSIIEKTAFTILVLLTIVSVFNYFKFNKVMVTDVNDYMDVTYYYTNSKYYSELGHADLYEAILVADEESRNRLKNVTKIRDLRTDAHVSRSKALPPERRAEIKAHFSPERWEEFEHDVNFLIDHYNNWRYLMSDRGYNPPATWTGVGGILSRSVPIKHMKIITMADFVLMVAAFLLVWRAFGISVVFFAVLWFTTTFSGRWPILGQALLRFDWVATLTMALCMLKMNRRGWAGGLIMYATLSRVFPLLFFFPYFVIMARDIVKERKISKEHLRFVLGAALVFTVVAGLALVQLGPHAFVETVDCLSTHSKTYSAHRVGLGVVMAYRGETSAAELTQHGGLEAKRHHINSMKRYYYPLALLLMGLSAWYIWRTKPLPHEVMYLAFIPFYIVFVMQTNYYNLRLVPVVTHAADLGRYRNRICLILLFFVETVTQYVMAQGAGRFYVTTAMSYALLPYFLFIIGFMTRDIIVSYRRNTPPAEEEKQPRRKKRRDAQKAPAGT